ncbi:hypothetical protein KFZ70_00545 [Tamlana fucoidanivorans]|uniref:DUF3592 domain-containing protein n=1 Tax=Allotamlana fucoidanivorans TaxID=2583814 RepID=A0A5C4SCM7_9FLAO|nr:hypothetical protein [Tamlana fucoidanivorans]TNJ41321.1 hypothetical protein FGF67_16150 [Tamlana fucoidanivorans]
MTKKIIILSIFSTIIIYGIFRKDYKSKKLLESGIKTTGVIVKLEHVKVVDYLIVYKYTVEGEIFKGYINSSFFECNKKNNCIGRKVEVIYYKEDPKISDVDLGEFNKFKRQHFYY